jgi:hypothetical protein
MLYTGMLRAYTWDYVPARDKRYSIGAYSFTTFQGETMRVGFFAAFFAVLAHLNWCDKHGFTPTIFWDERSAYYDAARGPNAWEYYFEPVSSLRYDAAHDTLITSLCAPDFTTIKHFCKHDEEYRLFVHGIIKKHIRLKPAVQEIIDSFYYEHSMDCIPTIGVHLRGTDKKTEIAIPHPLELIMVANKVAQTFKECQFFVATDEESLLDLARTHLHGPVISYPAQRSASGIPVHLDKKQANRSQLGSDVLVECILLSRCTALVHSHSNVSYTATFFNPFIDDYFVEASPKPSARSAINTIPICTSPVL